MTIPAPTIAARRAAALFVERYDLRPPIDVEALLRERADVQRVAWRGNSTDAVLTGLAAPVGRPLVAYRATDNLLRERFTLAHELGHIALPWHLPAKNCLVGDDELDLPRYSLESEADIFASSVLLPDVWLSSLLRRHPEDMGAVIRELNVAEVSTLAALLALKRVLLAGWVFIAYGDQVIESMGTILPKHIGSDLPSLRQELARRATSSGAALLNGCEVSWFCLVQPDALPTRNESDRRTHGEILRDSIARVIVKDEERLRAVSSCNGKVGGILRQSAALPAATIYRSLKYRFADSEFGHLVDEPDFLLWLAEKARSVEAGDTRRRRERRADPAK